MKLTKMTAPNGARVTVATERVENLVRNGFTEEKPKKEPAKKAASNKKND